jgi:predicted metalloprotease with PDZ domain
MKKLVLMGGALLILAAPALAGSGEKCTMDPQACLNHWAKSKDKGYLGLKYDKGAEGAVVVKEILAGSPAATAGFQVGDVLLAMNGAKMEDKEALKKAKGDWKVGQEVSYSVKRADKEQTLKVTLAQMPEEVFASMVGAHLLENHVATVTTASAGEAKADAKAAEAKAEKK